MSDADESNPELDEGLNRDTSELSEIGDEDEGSASDLGKDDA